MTSFTFHKDERLKSRKTIGKIFQSGESFIAYPFRVAWVPREVEDGSPFPVRFTQSVPKRRFAKAAHRNRIRRQIREAYRLNKHLISTELADQDHFKFALMVIYIGKEELPYKSILKATRKWIKIFLRKVKTEEKNSK